LNASGSAIPHTRVTTRLSAMHVWSRSTILLRHFTMRSTITTDSSRVAEPDEQLPRYGLRKRTAHQMASDDKSQEDASRHQSPSKRPKWTPTLTRTHPPSSTGPAKKRTEKGLGRRHTREDEGKAWSAEAILKESDSQYLIKYEPVYEGAQCEISWQPKHYANAALIAWWEKRKMEIALENGNAEHDSVPDLPSEDNGISRRYMPVESYGRPQIPVAGLLSLEQYDGRLEDFKQHTVKLVNKSTFQGNEEPVENTLLKAPTTIVPQFSNVVMPPINVAVARMYEHHKPRELHDSSPVALDNRGRLSASPRFKVGATLPAAVEDSHRCDKSQPRNDMVPEGGFRKSESRSPKAASSTGQHLEISASSRQLRMIGGENWVSAPVADDTKELDSYLVEASTAYVSHNRNDNASVQAAYGVRINDYRREEGSEQVPRGHVTSWGGQGRSLPCPGTSISTILSPVPSNISNNIKDDGSTTSTGKHSGQASLRTLAHVEVSNMRDSGVPSASLGKLASAREQLRLLLRGPGRRRYRTSRSLFPPSP
jgi:hypothetical protein